MLRRDEADLIAYVAEHSSGVALALHDATDQAAAIAALGRAVHAICRIPHPIEPDYGLPNWCTVLREDGIPVFHLDIKDDSQYAEQIVRIILDELDAAGVDGRLEPKRPPAPPFDYDGGADIFTGTDFLMEVDGRGLPPGFPADFPVPREATLVLAQRARDGAWEHAAWRRRGRPFTEYLDELRAFGCEFGSVPRAEFADYVNVLSMVRYAIRRAGEGGSVSLYHERRKPGRRLSDWYVSVVWHTGADLPPFSPMMDLPALPPAFDVGREMDPAAVHELVPTLVEPEYVTGCEMVLAIGAAGLVVNEVWDAMPEGSDKRTGPPWLHRRLAPLLDGLRPNQLAVIRHTCLMVIANRVNHGMARRVRLSLARDDANHLYVPDIRSGAGEALEPGQVGDFETLMALRGAAQALDALVHSMLAGSRELTGQLSRTLAGLSPEQLAEVRDSCWRIFSNEI
jgi:hypothetical protein